MHAEIALLQNYLAVSAVLFGVGLIGLLSRRNMIVMFLAVEMMLQGVSLTLVAFSRWHNNFDGQMLVVFIIVVAACEAAIALALIVTLFRRSDRLDVAVWQQLRESNQPPFEDVSQKDDVDDPPEAWPKLPPAGVAPEVSPEETDYRRNV